MTDSIFPDDLPADEFLAQLLRRRGSEINLQRARDGVLADQERTEARRAGAVENVRVLGRQVWRARRACEVARQCWQLEPGPDTQADLMIALRQRTTAEADLREAVLRDEVVFGAVLWETRP
jgi:hypothetical protein